MNSFSRFPSGDYVAIDQIRYMRVVDIDGIFYIGLKAKEDCGYINIGSKKQYDTQKEAQAELDKIVVDLTQDR